MVSVDEAADEVIVDTDVLCLFMELRILGMGKACLVITIEEWRIIQVRINAEVVE